MSQSLRILLIADDPEIIRRIGQGLQRQDSGLIMIEGAESLATAKRRLGAGACDLAVVDLALGRGDGLHLLADFREIAPDLPLVALATHAQAPDAAACLALGAQDRIAAEALDSAGLLDRLRSAIARARTGMEVARRSQRIAASLGATGDLAWHFEQGEDEVWLAAAEPDAWQLPAAESRESMESLRQRLHPDDRELTLRRIIELVVTAIPWQLEARVKVGGGAYRWCTLRGRSQLDAHGNLERASGVVSDTQRHQKRLRDLEQGRRFLRAIFDSNRLPYALLDSSSVITDCNQAWLTLVDPACHAGRDFGPGRRFTDPPPDPEKYGDLDAGELARGVRQVLGGVTDQFAVEYGDAERRFRIVVTPLLNPGIAGAVVCHEEITVTRRADGERLASLQALEADLRALQGPLFSLEPDFKVRATNAAGDAFGKPPVTGRDILKTLPRIHADAVGAALAEVSGGAKSAWHDSRRDQGPVIRWLVTARTGIDGNRIGFLVQGIDVSELAAAATGAVEGEAAEIGALRDSLVSAEREREAVRAALGQATRDGETLRESLATAERECAELRAAVATAEKTAAAAEKAAAAAAKAIAAAEKKAEAAERKSVAAERAAAEARKEHARNQDILTAERVRQGEILAALSAAEQIPVKLQAELDRARQALRAELDSLVERAFKPLLDDPALGPARREPPTEPETRQSGAPLETHEA